MGAHCLVSRSAPPFVLMPVIRRAVLVVVLICMMVMVFPRTGGMWNLSTTRLAMMPAAQLAPHDP